MLSENALLGFQYQESITGELSADIQARRLEEIGITYFNDSQRAKVKDLFSKIEANPSAFEKVVNDKSAELIVAMPKIEEKVDELL